MNVLLRGEKLYYSICISQNFEVLALECNKREKRELSGNNRGRDSINNAKDGKANIGDKEFGT